MHADETVVFRSSSNAVQLIITGLPSSNSDVDDVGGGPYFLIRYDGTRCHAAVVRAYIIIVIVIIIYLTTK